MDGGGHGSRDGSRTANCIGNRFSFVVFHVFVGLHRRRRERHRRRENASGHWPGPPTWAAFISLDRSLGLTDDYVTSKWNLQSTKSPGN
jgi:hypothetical protein